MRVKKLLGIILGLIVSVNMISCSKGTANAENDKSGGKPSLKISYIEYQSDIKKAIQIYREMYKDVDIQETVYKSGEYQEYQNKLSTELMSGNGPDVIIDNFGLFKSIHKVAANGLYYDLNKVISKDGEFKLSDYYEKVLDFGVFDGKRYFIPFKYQLDELSTTKEILSKNNINLNMSNWTWKGLAEAAKKYMEENKGTQKYFFDSEFAWFNPMVNNCGVSFIDYKNKKSKFNSPEFIELLEAYKDIKPSVCPTQIVSKYRTLGDAFNNGAYVITMSPETNYVGGMYGLYAEAKLFAGSDLQVFPLPNCKGNMEVYPKPLQSVGINSKCKYTKEAFNLIKIILSKDLQSFKDGSGNQNSNRYGVMNKNGYEDYKKCFSDDDLSVNLRDGKKMSGPLPQYLFDYMDSRIDKFSASDLIDGEIQNMIQEEADNYINGKKTAEQAAKDLDKKVTIYINE